MSLKSSEKDSPNQEQKKKVAASHDFRYEVLIFRYHSDERLLVLCVANIFVPLFLSDREWMQQYSLWLLMTCKLFMMCLDSIGQSDEIVGWGRERCLLGPLILINSGEDLVYCKRVEMISLQFCSPNFKKIHFIKYCKTLQFHKFCGFIQC